MQKEIGNDVNLQKCLFPSARLSQWREVALTAADRAGRRPSSFCADTLFLRPRPNVNRSKRKWATRADQKLDPFLRDVNSVTLDASVLPSNDFAVVVLFIPRRRETINYANFLLGGGAPKIHHRVTDYQIAKMICLEAEEFFSPTQQNLL